METIRETSISKKKTHYFCIWKKYVLYTCIKTYNVLYVDGYKTFVRQFARPRLDGDHESTDFGHPCHVRQTVFGPFAVITSVVTDTVVISTAGPVGCRDDRVKTHGIYCARVALSLLGHPRRYSSAYASAFYNDDNVRN